MRIFSGAGRCNSLLLALGLLATGGIRLAGAGPATTAPITADGPALLRVWAPPVFPPELLKKKTEARVTVRVIVDATGKVTAARVPEPGDARLDDAALAAVKLWVFAPAVVDDRPAASCLDIPVEFSSAKARKNTKPGLLPPANLLPRPAPRTEAEPLSDAPGDYPAILLERKLPGIVRFACMVSPEGRAEKVRIKGASHVDFVLPGMEALKKWTFKPAMEGDLAVPTELEGQVTFEDLFAKRADLLVANGLTTPDGTAPEYEPKLVSMPDPVWPLDALLAGEDGSATVEFTVNVQGLVTNVTVREASQPAFGEALRAATETWQFEPAIKDGMAIDVVLVKKMTFTAVPKDVPADADAPAQLVAKLRSGAHLDSARGLDAPLTPIYRVAPLYPQSLESGDRTAGEAVIELVIDREGRARLPKVISATKAAFGWAAATAAAQWVFKPCTRAGQPAEVKVRVPFGFDPPAE